MEFKGKGYVFECIPSCMNIRQEYETYLENVELAKDTKSEPPEEVQPVIIGLTGMTQPEWDRQTAREQEILNTYALPERLEKMGEITKELASKHFKSIKNLVIDGKEVTTFDDFYENAPPELVQWMLRAIFSTEILTASELKN